MARRSNTASKDEVITEDEMCKVNDRTKTIEEIQEEVFK